MKNFDVIANTKELSELLVLQMSDEVKIVAQDFVATFLPELNEDQYLGAIWAFAAFVSLQGHKIPRSMQEYVMSFHVALCYGYQTLFADKDFPSEMELTNVE